MKPYQPVRPVGSLFGMPKGLAEHVSSLPREVEETIRAIQHAECAAIEDVCRRAVEGGKHGVRVERVDGRLISVGVDSGVPYGQLHEHLHNSWSHVQPGAYEDLLCEMVRMFAAIEADRWYR